MVSLRPVAPRRQWLAFAGVLLIGLLGTVTLGAGGAAADDRELCSPPGLAAASAAPTNLASGEQNAGADRFTTATTEPLDKIDITKLGLLTPGKLSVGTLSDAPPSICVNSK